ncbi:MAG: MobA/MobL family protein, partial [Conexivisphaerales archaeon]
MVAVKNANTTIHYMGDISYFSTIKSKKYKSKVEMVHAHLKYLNKNLVASVGSKDMILSTAKKLDKRVNSRVAMKFHIAIPNDIPREHYNEFLNEVAIFLENQFNIDRNNIYIVLHETHKLGKTFGTENKHIHVVANTRTKDDKQIRLQPKDLSELHKNWDQFLMNYGYKIRKDKSKNNFKLGVKLRKDAELQALYKQHLNSQREIETLEREIRLAEMDRKLAKERAEREAREKAEREARERAERERAEREAREKAEREAREKAEREARERAER